MAGLLLSDVLDPAVVSRAGKTHYNSLSGQEYWTLCRDSSIRCFELSCRFRTPYSPLAMNDRRRRTKAELQVGVPNMSCGVYKSKLVKPLHRMCTTFFSCKTC